MNKDEMNNILILIIVFLLVYIVTITSASHPIMYSDDNLKSLQSNCKVDLSSNGDGNCKGGNKNTPPEGFAPVGTMKMFDESGEGGVNPYDSEESPTLTVPKLSFIKIKVKPTPARKATRRSLIKTSSIIDDDLSGSGRDTIKTSSIVDDDLKDQPSDVVNKTVSVMEPSSKTDSFLMSADVQSSNFSKSYQNINGEKLPDLFTNLAQSEDPIPSPVVSNNKTSDTGNNTNNSTRSKNTASKILPSHPCPTTGNAFAKFDRLIGDTVNEVHPDAQYYDCTFSGI